MHVAVAILALIAVVDCSTGFATHSGYIQVNPSKNSHLFYWLFEAQQNPAESPLVLWLSGGPGCSGGLAIFYENGPYWVDKELKLHDNPYSWNKYANMLYVDQPVGTGFSYADTDYVRNEEGVTQDMYTFLQKFLSLYPQYKKSEFYITGESYGGRYVPALGVKIATENEKGAVPINLRGISFGNGLTTPAIQYGYQGTFAYQEGLINQTVFTTVSEVAKWCQNYIDKKDWNNAEKTCESITSTIMKAAPGVDPTNINHHCKIQDCFNYDNITSYLNLPSVKKQIGALDNITWEACSYTLQFDLSDTLASFSDRVAALLEKNIRTLVYYGDKDLVCTWNGGLQWTWVMEWTGMRQYQNAGPGFWGVNGNDAGVSKSHGPLTYTTVFEAGHMAPHDQGEVCQNLFYRFLNNLPFSDH